jgi:hypothetical protein
VEFNNVSKKKYFPLPFTYIILDGVAGYDQNSFMDGFLGYNQISIYPPHHLIAFTTPWGIFAHGQISFSLCNSLIIFNN